jgi:hypothetical protein
MMEASEIVKVNGPQADPLKRRVAVHFDIRQIGNGWIVKSSDRWHDYFDDEFAPDLAGALVIAARLGNPLDESEPREPWPAT